MAIKLFPCLICVLFVVVLFSPECDAIGNGAGAGIPGKRTFMEKNDFQVSLSAMLALLIGYCL